jgi:hypothetical protein
MQYDISHTTSDDPDEEALGDLSGSQCESTPLTGDPQAGQSSLTFGSATASGADWRDHTAYGHLRRHFSGRSYGLDSGGVNKFTPTRADIDNGYTTTPRYAYDISFVHDDGDGTIHEVAGEVRLAFMPGGTKWTQHVLDLCNLSAAAPGRGHACSSTRGMH